MVWQLPGRVAVVTGASSGIGAATALRLARLGMSVVAVARRPERLGELTDRHPGIVPHVADVRDTSAVDALATRVADEFGVCHALVNNAGVRGRPFEVRRDLAAALEVVDTNLLGAMRVMASFADLLAASAPARVVNVASVAGKLGMGPAPYNASKFGLVGLSEAATLSWGRHGVRVCQLNPGFVETEGFPQAGLLTSRLGRLVARPDDVAKAVVDVLRSGQRERTVPRWYRGLIVARHVAAPLFWSLAGRVSRPGSPHG